MAVLGLMVGMSSRAKADTLASFLTNASGFNAYVGQSVTTAAGGPFDVIQFNFDDFNGNPTASGNLFIFTQAYTGPPSGLSSSATGFLAESTGTSGGVYQFAPTVTLDGSTQYFFYTQDVVEVEAGYGYTGGTGYLSFSSDADFRPANFSASAAFLLTGTPVAASVPEPSSAVLAGVGAATLAVCGWSRCRRAQRRQDTTYEG